MNLVPGDHNAVAAVLRFVAAVHDESVANRMRFG